MSVVADYNRFCDSIHLEPDDVEECHGCFSPVTNCTCYGPFSGKDAIDDTIDATRAAIEATPLAKLTTKVPYEADTEVADECTAESHEALKQSPLWQALEYVGIQHDIDEHGRDASLTMRNCDRCGSTLCKPATARERLIELLCKHAPDDDTVTSALALADEMAGVA